VYSSTLDAPTSQALKAWRFTLNVTYGAEHQRGGLLCPEGHKELYIWLAAHICTFI